MSEQTVGPGIFVTGCPNCGRGEAVIPPLPQHLEDEVRASLRRCPTCGYAKRSVSQLRDGPPSYPEVRSIWDHGEATGWYDPDFQTAA